MFSSVDVHTAVASEPVNLNHFVRAIYVAIEIDLDSGNFTAGAIANNVSMGMMRFDAFDWQSQMHAFLTQLRGHPMTRDAYMIVDVERGNGFASADVCAYIRDHFQRVTIIQDERKMGTITTRQTIEEMRERTHRVLSRVRFWCGFVCDLPAAHIKDVWAAQMTGVGMGDNYAYNFQRVVRLESKHVSSNL